MTSKANKTKTNVQRPPTTHVKRERVNRTLVGDGNETFRELQKSCLADAFQTTQNNTGSCHPRGGICSPSSAALGTTTTTKQEAI